MSLHYEAEISKIKRIDDSIEPEILMDITHTTRSMKSNSENLNEISQPSTSKYDPGMKKKEKNFDRCNVVNLQRKRREQRRHKEKLALLEKLCGRQKDKAKYTMLWHLFSSRQETRRASYNSSAEKWVSKKQ
nr:unnamed protein product [Callosobruchus analis]